MRVSSAYSRFAEVYDLIMCDVPYAEWADFALRLCGSSNGLRVLDLGCGTGTASYIFSDLKCVVTGIDISEEMLTQASVKASSFDRNSVPTFLRLDMRELPFEERFDLVVCFCDGINHLLTPSDIGKLFSGVYRSLVPGGIFVFDINTEYRLASVLGDNVFYDEFDGGLWVMENSYDPEAKVLESMQHLFLERDDGLYSRDDEICLERVYSSQELMGNLTSTGYEIMGEWADYSFDSPTETTERLVIAARRQ